MKLEAEVVIHTDGGCQPNPGVGGWAAILQYSKSGKIVQKEITGSDNDTTNNRMEMTAVLNSLKAINRPCNIVIYTDSQYVKQGIGNWINGEPTVKGWMVGWKEKGWQKRDGRLLNVDLWQALYREVMIHKSIKIRYIPSHSGHELNERCDQLAAEELQKLTINNEITDSDN